MPMLPDGLSIRTEISITDATQREYGFDFDLPPDLSGFHVRLNGVDVGPSLYTVSLRQDGTRGGVVRFLRAGQVPVPQALAVGDTLLMFRDTVVSSPIAAGAQGYARAVALSTFASWTRRVLEELTQDIAGHAEIILTPEEIGRLLLGGIKDFAARDGRAITLGDLLESDADAIEDSVDINRVSFDASTGTLTLTSHEGNTRTFTLTAAQHGQGGGGLPAFAVGDALQFLQVAADGLSVRFARVDADEVAVSAGGFTGNLASTDDDVQKALAKFDGYTPPPAGLDTNAVNRAIDLRVPAWARMTQRWTDEEREAIHAFTGDAWQTHADIEVATTWSSVARPANPENFTFARSASQGPHYTNVFAIVRLRTSRKGKLQLARFQIADPGGNANQYHQTSLLNGSGVVFLEDELGWSYYTVEVPDYPAGETYSGELLIPFELDPDKVAGLPYPWAQRGNVDLVPDDKLPTIPHVESATEFTLLSPRLQTSNSGSSLSTSTIALSPAADLDDTAYQHGEFHIHVQTTVALVSGTDANFGLEQGKANQTADDRTGQDSAVIFPQDLRASTNLTSGLVRGEGGIRVMRRPIYSLATLLGYAQVILVRDAQGGVGIRGYYETAGGNAENYVLDFQVRISWTPRAAAAAPPSGPVVSRPAVLLQQALAAAVNESTTGPGQWTTWRDLITLPAVADVGVVILLGSLHGEVTTPPSGGGDRVYLQARLVRTRMSADGMLQDSFAYIRNTGNANAGTTAQRDLVNEISGKFGFPIAIGDTAQVGDVYKISVRVLSQHASARTVQFDTMTHLQRISGLGGLKGDKGDKGDPGASAAIPVYNNVGALPAPGALASGSEANVLGRGNSWAARFIVGRAPSGSRNWKMLAGSVPLIEQRVNVPSIHTWTDTGVSILQGTGTIFDLFDWLSISPQIDRGRGVFPAAPYKNLNVRVAGATSSGAGNGGHNQVFRVLLGQADTVRTDVLYAFARNTAGNLLIATDRVLTNTAFPELAPLNIHGVPG